MTSSPIPSNALAGLPRGTGADSRPTLLFVDDEERILRSLRMLFAGKYRVLVTTSGNEALEILKREKVHALISDQRMPAMEGVELLRQAKEIAPNTMRLLLTGYADIEAIVGSINEGEVFRYINKPWNADEIRNIIAEAAQIAVDLDGVAVSGEAGPAASGEPHGMLLIDDAPEIAVALRALLEESFPGKFRLEWAVSLDDALTQLEAGGIDLLVSEVRVAGRDITPFLKTMKRLHPGVVTIVLTSVLDATLLSELINQGQVHRFLPKPVRRQMTTRGIQSGLDRHTQLRARPELARRHRVEAAPVDVDATLLGRIKGLFGRIGQR